MQHTSQNIKYSRSQHAGFSLIETMVAIGILVTAIVGPMTIAVQGLKSAFFAREQLTAVYLAQEGVELVRRMRDNHSLANTNALGGSDDWYNGASVPSACRQVGGGGCGLDARDLSVGATKDCDDSATACLLKFDTSAGITSRGVYTYQTGASLTNSAFTRKIYLTGDSAEAVVRVDVTWRSGLFGGNKTVTLRSTLTNQYDNY